MRSYQTARRYFSFQEILCKLLILVGIGVVVLTYIAMDQFTPDLRRYVSPIVLLIGYPLGIWFAFMGFSGLVAVQTGRAGVDSAEYAQQSLKISREQLEISKQALKQGATAEPGYAALQAAKEELVSDKSEPTTASHANTEKMEIDDTPEEPYEGVWQIEEKYGKFYAQGQVFGSKPEAIQFLKQQELAKVPAASMAERGGS